MEAEIMSDSYSDPVFILLSVGTILFCKPKISFKHDINLLSSLLYYTM